MPQLAKYVDCTGCMACVDSCPNLALKTVRNKEGHIVPLVDNGKCVNCGLCEKVCPVMARLSYSKSPIAKAFAAWAKDDSVREQSATAGAFAAFAQYILSIGGIVCGAANIDGLNICHICICKESELHRLQGSKYTQSNTTGIYKKIFDYLKEGKVVLFSGTGCQVAGLYGFLGKRHYKGILYTIDLICGGVPSHLLIDKFVESVPYKVKRIVSFRNKDDGWAPEGFKYNLRVEDESGQLHDYSNIRNLVTTGFACGMTNRYSCYNCQFAGTHRMSDFTIGDYWGITDYKEQHRNGVSVIVAHNELALDFLGRAHEYIEAYESDLSDILSHNKRLGKCVDNKYKLPERKYMGLLFNKFSYKTLNKIYAFGFSNKSPWILYKVYRLLISKFL